MVGQTIDAARRSRPIVVGSLTIAAICAFVATLVLLPPLIVHLDTLGLQIATQDQIAAVNSTRSLMLQAAAGLAVAIGALAAWRWLAINAQEVRDLRDGQLTDRFIRAIEQLGNSESVDIRVGAIFALDRIARSSPDDRDAVIATLSSFVRTHSPWPHRLADQPSPDEPSETLRSLGSRAPDVQRALATIGHIPHGIDGEWIRLQNTDLRSARIWQYNLDLALLMEADLRYIRAWEASLVGVDLSRSDLRNADLRGVDLRHALLMGTDLRGADLTGANFNGAEADEKTLWPEGFDPAVQGIAILTSLEWRSRARHRIERLRDAGLLHRSLGRRHR